MKHRVVFGRIDHHGDIAMVLGPGADHRRSADVDILDDRRGVGAAGQRLLERIEVGDQHIDAGNAVGLHGLGMLGIVANSQEPAMDTGMQGLHPAVHDLGKAGQLGDVAHGKAGLAQRPIGAAGGDQLDIKRRQFTGEIDETGLVEDRQQRAANPHAIGGLRGIGFERHRLFLRGTDGRGPPLIVSRAASHNGGRRSRPLSLRRRRCRSAGIDHVVGRVARRGRARLQIVQRVRQDADGAVHAATTGKKRKAEREKCDPGHDREMGSGAAQSSPVMRGLTACSASPSSNPWWETGCARSRQASRSKRQAMPAGS